MLFFQEMFGQVLLSVLFIRLTAVAGASERFTNPPENAKDLTYVLGSNIQITWQTDLEFVALTLFQTDENGLEYLPNSANLSNTNSYSWSVGSVTDPAVYPSAVGTETNVSNKVFYFQIFDPGNTTAAIISSRFRIVVSPSASTTSLTASSSSASTLAVVSSTSSSSSVSSSTTSTQSLNSASSTAIPLTSGISQSAKTGLGVGIGIGIPLLLAMGIYLGWKFRGRRTVSNDGRGPTVDTSLNFGVANFQPAPQDSSWSRVKNLANSHSATQELSGSTVSELHSTPVHQIQ